MLEDELWMRQHEKPFPNHQTAKVVFFWKPNCRNRVFCFWILRSVRFSSVFRKPISNIFIGFHTPLDVTCGLHHFIATTAFLTSINISLYNAIDSMTLSLYSINVIICHQHTTLQVAIAPCWDISISVFMLSANSSPVHSHTLDISYITYIS